MKTQTQKTLTIAELFESIQSLGMVDARKIYQSFTGSRMSVSGTIAKVIKGEKVKLLIESKMKIFAEFPNADFLLMVGKGKTVELSGTLQSFGFDSLCLNGCRITKIL